MTGSAISLRQAALAAATALALTAPAVPAVAQEGAFFKDVLGAIGFIPRERDPIVYRERPGLVVPPGSTLPPPVAPTEQRNAQWPRDPEVVEKEREIARARLPQGAVRDSDPSQGGRLSVDEIRAGRRLGEPRQAEFETGEMRRRSGWIHPDDLRRNAGPTDAERDAALGYNTERRYLSDPPAALRAPAATATFDPRGARNRDPIRRTESAGERDFATTGRARVD